MHRNKLFSPLYSAPSNRSMDKGLICLSKSISSNSELSGFSKLFGSDSVKLNEKDEIRVELVKRKETMDQEAMNDQATFKETKTNRKEKVEQVNHKENQKEIFSVLGNDMKVLIRLVSSNWKKQQQNPLSVFSKQFLSKQRLNNL